MTDRPAPECATWTVDEAAAVVGVSRTKMYALVASDQIPHLRLGARIVVPKRQLEAWIAQMSVGTPGA